MSCGEGGTASAPPARRGVAAPLGPRGEVSRRAPACSRCSRRAASGTAARARRSPRAGAQRRLGERKRMTLAQTKGRHVAAAGGALLVAMPVAAGVAAALVAAAVGVVVPARRPAALAVMATASARCPAAALSPTWLVACCPVTSGHRWAVPTVLLAARRTLTTRCHRRRRWRLSWPRPGQGRGPPTAPPPRRGCQRRRRLRRPPRWPPPLRCRARRRQCRRARRPRRP